MHSLGDPKLIQALCCSKPLFFFFFNNLFFSNLLHYNTEGSQHLQTSNVKLKYQREAKC